MRALLLGVPIRRERPELIPADGTLVACHAVEERRLPAA
jgi:hypothetical protein